MSTIQYGQYNVPHPEDCLNMGCGQPGNEYLNPAAQLYSEIQSSQLPLDVFQYGKRDGHSIFKKMVMELNKKLTDDQTMEEEQIYMTNGISQAMLMLTSVLGSMVQEYAYVESPTYFLIPGIFENNNFKLREFSISNVDSLLCNIYSEKYVFLYIIPFHQNPTGYSFTQQDINKLVKLCNSHPNLLVLSDETYQFLSFDNTAPKSLATYHKNIISMCTFSKFFAPAVRTGWLYTKNKIILNMLDESGYMDSGGAVNPMIAYQLGLIDTQKIIDNIYDTRKSLSAKCDVICNALSKYPSIFSFNKPTGGYFVWVTINTKHINSSMLLNIAKRNKITFHVGQKFVPDADYVTDCCTNKFRLSFSYYTLSELEKYFEKRIDSMVYDIENTDLKTAFVHGYKGRLGSLICEELVKNKIKVVNVSRTYDELYICESGIVVDVSSPQGTSALLQEMLNKKIYMDVIIGTTGELTESDINLRYFYKNTSNKKIIECPNFSIGIQHINKLMSTIAIPDNNPSYWNTIDIVDNHHIFKKDFPSGTAKLLLKSTNLTELEDVKIAYEKEDETPVITQQGKHIKNKPEIFIQCIRSEDTVGEHTVTLESNYEIVTVSHMAKDRRLFAIGCVNMIKNLFDKNFA